ncbi:MAG TPA: hypothetical protein VHC22_01530 [Pirellulales bacterium]|nr:hypothetical protein [Pirellulales bacterium]
MLAHELDDYRCPVSKRPEDLQRLRLDRLRQVMIETGFGGSMAILLLSPSGDGHEPVFPWLGHWRRRRATGKSRPASTTMARAEVRGGYVPAAAIYSAELWLVAVPWPKIG